jgi:hypothetical protein
MSTADDKFCGLASHAVNADDPLGRNIDVGRLAQRRFSQPASIGDIGPACPTRAFAKTVKPGRVLFYERGIEHARLAGRLRPIIDLR